nr:uncharacterized protein LOC107451109 [Parasteatoda tepidariorum]XP_015922585.1 uncharacterized protein LOC107451109 [Parasteatoda tepidariorum]XP_015922586.1 uncharacterized protein LOC107451109 [Parasteatoda tepidariorum]XP_015922587.1 uncharacterized protein LOC107451109 [Parasteatoda tepidariorum]XP_015922588.1 uncharacterized protein LOC107451109 [Parasteatoda tepidariorum]XP_042901421.1 uncharacterized protein LOC107451109 [Parasteatoda tepidariorum]XP_042901422.1 uncharacterized prot
MNSLCLIRFQKTTFFSCFSHLKMLHASTKFITPSRASNSSFLKATNPLQTQACSFWETFPAPNLSHHAKDGLNRETNTLIYKSKLFNYAFYSQFVSILGFSVQLVYSIKYAYQSAVLHEPVVLNVGPFTATFDLLSLFILGIFTLQNIVLFHMAQRALLRIYHRPKTDDYVFVTLALNPFKSRLFLCKPGELEDLKKYDLRAMMGNYAVHGRKIFVLFENFRSAHHFNKLTDKMP